MSIETFIELWTGTEGYKCTTSYETCTSTWDICQDLASFTNVYELMTWCLLFFKNGCIISTKYILLYGAVPTVDTMIFIGWFFFKFSCRKKLQCNRSCNATYIAASYRIYLETQQLQHQKVNFAIAKNQFLFPERYMANNITPKSFRKKSPILTKEGKNLIRSIWEKYFTTYNLQLTTWG